MGGLDSHMSQHYSPQIRLSHCSMPRLDLESSRKVVEIRYFLFLAMAQSEAIFSCRYDSMTSMSRWYATSTLSHFEISCMHGRAGASQRQVIFAQKTQTNHAFGMISRATDVEQSSSAYYCTPWSLGYPSMVSCQFNCDPLSRYSWSKLKSLYKGSAAVKGLSW
jgi:hypothetical protein